MMDSTIQHHQAGSRFQKQGDYSTARRYFQEILDMPDESGSNRFHSGALYHLGQLADDWNEKKDYLEKCLQLEPDHRMAHVLLSCLTPQMEKRIRDDESGLIRPFFEKYPLNVQFQTISACNAKCTMCPYHFSWQKLNPGRMSDEVFEHIVYLLKGIPLGKVCMYLEDEPLLDKRLFDRIETVKANLNYQLIEVSSNGSTLTRSNVEKLHRAFKDTAHQVWVSWHGITPESYKKIMGFDFDKNLEKLRDYLRITNGELKTVIRSIVGGKLDKDQKYTSLEEADRFFQDIIDESGVPASNISVNTFKYHDRAGGIETEGEPDPVYLEMKGKLKPDCSRLTEWFHVLYDGSAILCCMDYHKETVMANILDYNSLEEVFLSDQFVEIREQALGIRPSADDFICKRCTSPGG